MAEMIETGQPCEQCGAMIDVAGECTCTACETSIDETLIFQAVTEEQIDRITLVATLIKDFFGTPLAVGDSVALSVPTYKDLVRGQITKFTPQKVHVSYMWAGREQSTIQWPANVVKDPRK